MESDVRRSRAVSSVLVAPPPERSQSGGLSFEELYRSCAEAVFAYACTLLRDPSAAEEATALAFERAYRRRASFDPRRGSQRAWLFGIVRNAALDELRRRRRIAPLYPHDRPDQGEELHEAAERVLRRSALARALSSLPARDRELIALKFHAGLSNVELAALLGVSETNAGTRLHRALTRLRKAFDETA
jgi:RNA polymerase sigma-70 factor (ECF subfamily)